jgi:DNA-binding transcriptional LysR family regulator
MQQPPLSRQISVLERELKVQLFRRMPRGVELTSAGQALFRESKAIVTQLDRAMEITRRTARGEQGSLCVGIAPTAPFNPLVPKAIRSFSETFPRVSLVLEEGLSHEVVSRFNDDRMDGVRARAANSCGRRYGRTPSGGTNDRGFAKWPSDGRPADSRLFI